MILKQPTIGLLPHYISLYDVALTHIRPRMEEFYLLIVEKLTQKGVKVVTSEVCCVKNEFRTAVENFEKQGVDAIVSLHLAYSPSLESAHILAATKLPLIILDTTPEYDMSAIQNPEQIDFNHGIHGVQDLCNLLWRNGKDYYIEVGHWDKSDVLNRVAYCARAAMAANVLRNSRIGIVGEPFDGMGDFAVSESILRENIGIQTIHCNPNELREYAANISELEIENEMERYLKTYEVGKYTNQALKNAATSCLTLRKWINKENLSGFTINFMAVDKKSGLESMPFLEPSEAMSRGIGYAGEGDVLTAALMTALSNITPEVSFVEMFCPDWKNSSIFISHMGEMNLSLTVEKPTLFEVRYPYTDVGSAMVACGLFKSGQACIVNLAPGPNDKFKLTIANGKMLAISGLDNMNECVRGWFQPNLAIEDFLSAYSLGGATHHSVLVYGDNQRAIYCFGQMMGWEISII